MTDLKEDIDIDKDKEKESIPVSLRFPKCVCFKTWGVYIGRDLLLKERIIIENAKTQHRMNVKLDDLQKNINEHGLYIPMLTELHGNCMFESLVYHNIGNNIEDLRKSLACLMWIFRDYKKLDPQNNMTLKEQFEFATCNEIEYVKLKPKNKQDNSKHFYKYSYNIMCQDLTNEGCWTRLPAETMLRALCLFFNLRIVIYHTNDSWVTDINIYSNKTDEEVENLPKLTKIYLGQLEQSHYVPLAVREGNNLEEEKEEKPMYYNDSNETFIKWALAVEQFKIRKYKEMKELENIQVVSDEEFIDLDYSIVEDNNLISFTSESTVSDKSTESEE